MVKRDEPNPFENLRSVFHEPSRLSVVSFLSGAADGLTFAELKERSGLTDGNLSRHLKTLEGDGVVTIEKAFVGARPCTTARLTRQGRKAFMAYLSALEEALISATLEAGRKTPSEPDGERPEPFWRKLLPRGN